MRKRLSINDFGHFSKSFFFVGGQNVELKLSAIALVQGSLRRHAQNATPQVHARLWNAAIA